MHIPPGGICQVSLQGGQPPDLLPHCVHLGSRQFLGAVLGNMAVMVAALGVWGTATGWPGLIVATFMAGLFLSSSVQIIRQSLQERRQLADHGHGAPRLAPQQRHH